MFAVQHKKTGEIREVYDILYDPNIFSWENIIFLTYDFKDRMWEKVASNEWMPTTVEKKEGPKAVTAEELDMAVKNKFDWGCRSNPICPQCGSIDHVIYTDNPETLITDFGCTRCGKRWSKPTFVKTICPKCGDDRVVSGYDQNTISIVYECVKCGKIWSKPLSKVGQN